MRIFETTQISSGCGCLQADVGVHLQPVWVDLGHGWVLWTRMLPPAPRNKVFRGNPMLGVQTASYFGRPSH